MSTFCRVCVGLWILSSHVGAALGSPSPSPVVSPSPSPSPVVSPSPDVSPSPSPDVSPSPSPSPDVSPSPSPDVSPSPSPDVSPSPSPDVSPSPSPVAGSPSPSPSPELAVAEPASLPSPSPSPLVSTVELVSFVSPASPATSSLQAPTDATKRDTHANVGTLSFIIQCPIRGLHIRVWATKKDRIGGLRERAREIERAALGWPDKATCRGIDCNEVQVGSERPSGATFEHVSFDQTPLCGGANSRRDSPAVGARVVHRLEQVGLRGKIERAKLATPPGDQGPSGAARAGRSSAPPPAPHLGWVISTGLTHASNCSAVSSPSSIAAALRVVPFW